MTAATLTTALRRAFSEAPDVTTPRQPPRRKTGPVLMGDIHGVRNGVPLLLLLWAQWEQEARDDSEEL